MRILWITALVAFLIDQISKYIVIHVMELWRVFAIDVLPPLVNFRYGENHGINFGIGGDGVNKWVWVAIALAICGWLVWWMGRAGGSTFARVCVGTRRTRRVECVRWKHSARSDGGTVGGK